MKKAISTLLALFLLVSAAGCSVRKTEEEQTAVSSQSVGDSAEPAKKESPSDTPNDSNTMQPETAEPTTQQTAGSSGEPAFSETVVVDNAVCRISFTAYDADGIWGPTFDVQLENRTEKKLMFSIQDASVNGMMCDPFWATEVAAGKSANSEVSWSTSTLSDLGIRYIQTVELRLRIYDSEDWTADDLYDDVVTLTVPANETGAAIVPVTYDHGFTETTLVLFDEATVIAKDFNPEGWWGPTLVLYLENKTDRSLLYTMEDVSVNGIMCDPFWATEVMAGKKAYANVSWLKETLEENGIDTIETIEFNLRVYDAEDWTADDLFSSVLTLNIDG